MNFLFVFIGSILIKNYCYNNFIQLIPSTIKMIDEMNFMK